MVLMPASYAKSNALRNAISIYSLMHSSGMNGRELLQLLLAKRGLTANALAKALKGGTTQPQISKFLTGVAAEPRRSTLAPVAVYFGVPIDAFYDDSLAERVALQLGLVDAAEVSAETLMSPGVAAHGAAAPIPFPPPPPGQPNLRDSLRAIREALAHEPMGVRRSVAAIMADLAERAEDETFGEQMIERIMGALGRQGNDAPPQSTPSPQNRTGGVK